MPLAFFLASTADGNAQAAACRALRKMGGPGEIAQVYQELASKAATEVERRRYERLIPLFKY